jgi:RNA polymerase sigma-B factor
MIDAAVAGILAAQLGHAEDRGVALAVAGASGLVLDVLEVLDLSKALGVGRTSAPERPQLPCCGPAADVPEAEPPALPEPRSSSMMPDAAIGERFVDMAGLDLADPHRRKLHDEVVALALPAAHRIAARYGRRGESGEDLRQVAAVGLLKAVDGYDPARGHAFSDYAIPTILGELRRYFRDRGWAVHVPRPTKELLLDARRAADALTQGLGRSPRAADVAESLGVATSSVERAVMAAQAYRPQSLSSPVEGGTIELGDVIGALDPAYEYVDNWHSIAAVLRELPERTRRVLALRFCEDLSQADIAERIGVSQVHVSRILNQAFVTLRATLFADE